jgi:hypothetical protein
VEALLADEPVIETLTVQLVRESEVVLKPLLTAPGLRNLKRLEIGRRRWDPEWKDEKVPSDLVLKWIASNRSFDLEALRVFNCGLGSLPVLLASPAVRSLKSLSLLSCLIEVEAAAALAAAPIGPEALDLSASRFYVTRDRAVEATLVRAPWLRNLRSFSISRNLEFGGDKLARFLSEGDFAMLEELDASFAFLDDVTLRTLAALPPRRLRRADFRRNNLGEDVQLALRAAWPGVELLFSEMYPDDPDAEPDPFD